jgi:hypothetical protein
MLEMIRCNERECGREALVAGFGKFTSTWLKRGSSFVINLSLSSDRTQNCL